MVTISGMAKEVLDPDPQINAVLLHLRGQLRAALMPGNFGTISVRDCTVKNGRLLHWESGYRETLDVSSLTNGRK